MGPENTLASSACAEASESPISMDYLLLIQVSNRLWLGEAASHRWVLMNMGYSF